MNKSLTAMIYSIILLVFFIFSVLLDPSKKIYTFIFSHSDYKAYQHFYNEVSNLLIVETIGSGQYQYTVIKGENIIIHVYPDFLYIVSKGHLFTEFEAYYWNKAIDMLLGKFPDLITDKHKVSSI